VTEAQGQQTTDTGTEAEASVEQRSGHGPRLGDWIITAGMLALFVAAYFLAEEWPFRAALFPQIVAVAGAGLAVLKLAGLGLATVRSRRAPQGLGVAPSTRAAELPEQPRDSSPESESIRTSAVAGEEQRAADAEGPMSELTFVDDEQGDDQSMEYVFASAGGRSWASSLAWITAFFVSFFVLGAYITVPLFALFYLRFVGKASWLASAIYAVVVGAVIFFVFRELVFIPLPESVFPFLDF
jgi:Tripartite tricarboxylate transporter TctB family